MTNKELVKQAIYFKGPERVPIRFAQNPDASDIVGLGFKQPKGWAPSKENEDEWGCIWDNIIKTGLGQVKGHPIDSWDKFETYKAPDPHDPSRFEDLPAAAERYKDKYLTAGIGISGFNKLTFLRGFENLLADIYTEPEKFNKLADIVFDFETGLIKEYAKFPIDAIWFGDDWGTERSLIINPVKWREVFKPRYKKQFDLCHKQGMDVIFHSCGYIWDIIPDFIEIGVNVLNCEQPMIFGVDRLAKTFGGKVCFHTNVDGQKMLPTATPEEIVAEARHLIEAFRPYNGGFIAYGDATADHGYVPPENVRAMSEAFITFGRLK
jgi:uroporphyrinogen decarboxylase